MSREIKFRAWHDEGKSMCPIAQGEFYELDAMLEEAQWHVMQYTGLKDKNGKEIYEEDIVKGFYPDLGTVKFGDHETSTDYYASSAYGWYIETPGKEEYALMIKENTEIIGNIYENPELVAPTSL